MLTTCLGEQLPRKPGPSPVMDGPPQRQRLALLPLGVVREGKNGCALPHRLPLAGQALHSVYSAGPWAALPLSAQAPGALILGHWALSLVWSHCPCCCSHSLAQSLVRSQPRLFEIFTNPYQSIHVKCLINIIFIVKITWKG